MDTKEFLEFGKAAIDFVANYTDTIRSKNVLPDVEPGYLSKILPEEAPQSAEPWQEVLKDVERYIIPGVSFHEIIFPLFLPRKKKVIDSAVCQTLCF